MPVSPVLAGAGLDGHWSPCWCRNSPEGQYIVAIPSPSDVLGFPEASPGFPDRPRRPQDGSIPARVTKVVILGIKVAYSQAGMTSRPAFEASLGEIGALLLIFARNYHSLSLLRHLLTLLSGIWASWALPRVVPGPDSCKSEQRVVKVLFCAKWSLCHFYAALSPFGPIPGFREAPRSVF